jgi:hypothetical protein
MSVRADSDSTRHDPTCPSGSDGEIALYSAAKRYTDSLYGRPGRPPIPEAAKELREAALTFCDEKPYAHRREPHPRDRILAVVERLVDSDDTERLVQLVTAMLDPIASDDEDLLSEDLLSEIESEARVLDAESRCEAYETKIRELYLTTSSSAHPADERETGIKEALAVHTRSRTSPATDEYMPASTCARILGFDCGGDALAYLVMREWTFEAQRELIIAVLRAMPLPAFRRAVQRVRERDAWITKYEASHAAEVAHG